MNSFYMAVVLLVLCLTAIGLVNTRQFHLQNNLGYTVWVAIKGDSGRVAPDNGGFVLYAGGRRSVNVEDSWAGRFWARTGCNFGGSGYGRCVTGDCGNKLHCNETEVMSLATVAEITLAGFGGKDYYDVSFLSGFNVPVQRNVNMPDNWGGYFWARTGCNFDDSGHGRCATGDCGGKLHCTAGHMPPASLAEFNFELIKGLDIYCVSLINGFNVAIQIKPSNGRGYQHRCGTAGCVNNLNPSCPNNLQVRKGNEIVACDNACYALNTDTDCCQGDLSPVEKCQSSDTTEHFKRNCPNACTYASDDTSCNFICENTDYDIIFG
ncbi:uncharacterized protein [Periplaneta americana]|uniref:uncharacterized protein isoform X2 n=1 Tax=Periplaneta americana TaxID=6978 RepID=UPI0037E715AA